jgi:chloramphenicol 3-O-phosphotransferase
MKKCRFDPYKATVWERMESHKARLRDPEYSTLADSFPSRPSKRLLNVMYDCGMECLADGAIFSEGEWLRMPNFGKQTLRELSGFLHLVGLRCHEETDVGPEYRQCQQLRHPWFEFAF